MDVLNTLLISLTLGAYKYTHSCYKWLHDEIVLVKTNHMKHVEDRLTELERRCNEYDERPDRP